MSARKVKALSPKGRVVELVESAFLRVWQDRGYRLVTDVESEIEKLVHAEPSEGTEGTDSTDHGTGETVPPDANMAAATDSFTGKPVNDGTETSDAATPDSAPEAPAAGKLGRN